MVDTHTSPLKHKMCTFPAVRFVILVLGTLTLTMFISNILIWNFTKLCMVESKLSEPSKGEKFNHTKFRWSDQIQSTIFSAFAWSATICVMPLTLITQKYGVRCVVFVVGLLSGGATLVSPVLAVKFGFAGFLLCRLVQGLGYSIIMSAVAAVTAYWAPQSEYGIFLGILTSAIQLSPVVTMPMAGALCTSSWGWPAVYYVHGLLTLILSAFWVIFFRNQPDKHIFVSAAELEAITLGKSAKIESTGIPWKSMAGTAAIWAILISTFGNMFGVQLLIYYTPTYLKNILNFDLMSSGVLAAMPYLIQFGVKIVAGLMSDRITCVLQTHRLKVFNSIALVGMAAFMAGLGFVPVNNASLGVGILVCAAAILGFNAGGFFKSASIVAKQFSPLVMGFVQFITCVILLIVPYIKGAIVRHDDNIAEWRIIFLLAAGILILCDVVFVIFGSGTPASWTSERPPQIEKQAEDENPYTKGTQTDNRETQGTQTDDISGFSESTPNESCDSLSNYGATVNGKIDTSEPPPKIQKQNQEATPNTKGTQTDNFETQGTQTDQILDGHHLTTVNDGFYQIIPGSDCGKIVQKRENSDQCLNSGPSMSVIAPKKTHRAKKHDFLNCKTAPVLFHRNTFS